MPEGDTIHSAARRIGAALVGRQIVLLETPQERHLRDRWPQRLEGRGVRAVDAHGKHLFVRFDGDLTLHIGNIWKSEGCFLARLDPWRRVRDYRADAAAPASGPAVKVRTIE
jgi:formamidopyrimidine-DNA glycosylase